MAYDRRLLLGKKILGRDLEGLLVDSARFLNLHICIGDEFGDFNNPEKTYKYTKFEVSTNEKKGISSVFARTNVNINEYYTHLGFECDDPKKSVNEYIDEFLKRVREY